MRSATGFLLKSCSGRGPAIRGRCYASAAAVQPSGSQKPGGVPTQELKMTRMAKSGLMVTSLDRGSPLSRLAVIFRAGSRYEGAPELYGIAHKLRNCFGLSTEDSTQISLLWRSGSIGSSMTSSLTKDFLILTLSCPREYAAEAMMILGEAACKPAMKTPELEDYNHKAKLEFAVADADPAFKAMELLHTAAYRHGPLGNALSYSPLRKGMGGWPYNSDVDPWKHESIVLTEDGTRKLQKYAMERMVSGEAGLIGLDVDHQLLLSYAAEGFPVKNGTAGNLTPSPYKGGIEMRETGGPHAHVLIASEGASIGDAKKSAILSVLGALVGNGPVVKHSDGVGLGRVAKALNPSINGEGYAASVFTVSHAICGLFGLYFIAPHNTVGEIVKNGLKPLTDIANKGVTESELATAKTKAQRQLMEGYADGSALLEDLAVQTMASGSVSSVEDASNAINNVSASDIQSITKKMITSKLSMSAVGNISNVPYLDELM